MSAQQNGVPSRNNSNEPPIYWPNPRMLFTGPDYNRDHRVTVQPENRMVGIGTMSKEGTSESDYLWRAAPRTPYPRSKSSMVGGIGWGIQEFTDWSMPITGRQVMMGEFRQELENSHAHKYQNPWYPGPNDEVDPNSDEAMVMNVYKRRPATTVPQPSGTCSRPWRHRGRTPAATPLYTVNTFTVTTSSGTKAAPTSDVPPEGQPVKAY
ncbi:protein SPMIP2-like isoform X1 [Haliotis cracherodii]|uniref:protein SPMIP2-like isoform X1 n=1 Tax=Haliotis cracherodii TaxID=6455 RepID=UPI0039EC0590